MKLLNKVPKYVLNILNILEGNGYKSYLVGGSVRDLLLDRQPKDFDITTSALPRQVQSIFKHVILTDEEYGKAVVVTDYDNIEITTMRKDGIYKDNRRPETVEFTDNIFLDLARRDFVINSMALDLNNNLIDPFGGVNDLRNKIIKTTGNSNARFLEDGLRPMRCIRFSCVLNFDIEQKTEQAVIRHKDLIKNISSERIQDELCKILISDNASYGIRKLYETGLLQHIIPELCDCVNFDQHNPNHHKDVYEHTLLVLDSVSNNLIIRLAALLHDIAKPLTFSLDENGCGHFYKHHLVGADLSREILERLKYDNKTIDTVCILVKYHMDRYDFLRTSSVKKFINRIGIDNLDALYELQIADIKAGKAEQDFCGIEKLKADVKKILEEKQPLTVKDLKINGYDLMALGMKPGKEMGLLLNEMLELVLEKPELNDGDYLVNYVKEKLKGVID